MKNTLKALSVALLLMNIAPAFGMARIFGRLQTGARQSWNQVRTFGQRYTAPVSFRTVFAKPAQTMKKFAKPAVVAGWFWWDYTPEQAAEKAKNDALYDSKVTKAIMEDDKQWQQAAPLMDRFVLARCNLLKENGASDCAQTKRLSLDLLQTERQKRLEERDQENKKAADKKEKEENKEIERVSHAMYETIKTAPVEDLNGKPQSIATIEKSKLEKMIAEATRRHCRHGDNHRICSTAKNNLTKALDGYRDLVNPRVEVSVMPPVPTHYVIPAQPAHYVTSNDNTQDDNESDFIDSLIGYKNRFVAFAKKVKDRFSQQD